MTVAKNMGQSWAGWFKSDASDSTAFVDAVTPCMGAVTRLAVRLGGRESSEDIVQEALLRAWKSRSRFDRTKGTFSSWLLAIVANEARRAVSRQTQVLPGSLDLARSADAESASDLKSAIHTLPERQLMAIDCYYFAGLSIAETAAAMGCSEGTVKSTLADARANLRKRMEPI